MTRVSLGRALVASLTALGVSPAVIAYLNAGPVAAGVALAATCAVGGLVGSIAAGVAISDAADRERREGTCVSCRQLKAEIERLRIQERRLAEALVDGKAVRS